MRQNVPKIVRFICPHCFHQGILPRKKTKGGAMCGICMQAHILVLPHRLPKDPIEARQLKALVKQMQAARLRWLLLLVLAAIAVVVVIVFFLAQT